MTASNTRDCFCACVGKRVKGVLFDAIPVGREDLSSGTKTLIFEDGSGLTIASNGSFWLDSVEQIQRAILRKLKELEVMDDEIKEVLEAAGAMRW
jgi:hypothetical protein